MDERHLRPIAAALLVATWVIIVVLVFSYVFIKIVDPNG